MRGMTEGVKNKNEEASPEQAAVADGWDLHCHTTFSDGTVTPQGMLDQASRLGLAGVAVTDHDTTASWVPAKESALDLPFPLIRGTEITSQWGKTSVHLLAYLYDCQDQAMLDLFAYTREKRQERAKEMVKRISRDYPISWEDVQAQIKSGSQTTVGRPHIADALVAAGVYPTRSAAFAGAISSHSPYYIPVYSPDAETVVKTVKQAGGVAVVAHPAAVSRNKVLLPDEEIERLTDLGLDGLEVRHRDNPPDQQERLNRLAGRLHLLVTGGSDWHGQGKPNRLGENLTDPETVAEIIRRGRIRVLA